MTSDVTTLPDDADFTLEHLAAMQAARNGDTSLLPRWPDFVADSDAFFAAHIHTFVMEMEVGLGQ